MSRICRLPIDMPKTVKASFDNGVLNVEGPKGKLSLAINPIVSVDIQEGKIVVSRSNDEKVTKATHGLTRQLVRNMVVGVSEGYKKNLLIVGVGYKAEAQNDRVIFSLGYANDIEYVIPAGVQIACETPNKVTVTGIDKQIVGQVAAEIRSLRKPEPYKGKGIKYETEHVRSKSGQSGKK